MTRCSSERRGSVALAIAAVALLAPAAMAYYGPADAPAPAESGSTPPSPAPSASPTPPLSLAATVVVTASRKQEAIKNAPISITPVGELELGVTPATNAADLLRRVPGMNAVQFSARDVQLATRSASGITINSLLPLVDGRNVLEDSLGIVYWDLLPVDYNQIRQVEVIRGPGSAVWGANAMNGVVNVVTRSPREMEGSHVVLGGGERGTVTASAVQAIVDGRLSYKVSGGYYAQDAWDRDTTLPDGTPLPAFENKGTKQPRFDTRIDFDRTDDERWSVSGGFARSSGLVQGATGPLEFHAVQQGYGRALWSRKNLEVSAFVNTFDADFSIVFSGPERSHQTVRTVGLEARDQRVIAGRHILVYGGTVRDSIFDLPFVTGADHRANAGAYAEDDIVLGERFHARVGARLDTYETIGSAFSPRAGLLFHVTPRHTLRATYNRAYRAPTAVENYLDLPLQLTIPLPAGPYVVPFHGAGSADLSNETLDGFEVGYTGTVGKATIGIAAYSNRIKDLIRFLTTEVYSPASPPPGWPLPPELVPPLPAQLQFQNVGSVTNRGLETSIEGEVARGFSAFANYSFQANPRVSSPTPLELNRPPRHRANVGVDFECGRYLGSASFAWVDRAFWADVLSGPFHGYTDAYGMLNGSFGVRAGGGLTLLVRGTNLTNQRIKQHIFGDVIHRRVLGELRFDATPHRSAVR